MRSVVTTWYGTFLLEEDRIVRSEPAPEDAEALVERMLLRWAGALTPEESAILVDRAGEPWQTGDRRLVAHGLTFAPAGALPELPSPTPVQAAARRPALLRAAERALEASWDPSIHLEEAVRALADLDRVQNLIGERLASWVSRDSPDLDASDHARAVTTALAPGVGPTVGSVDPALGDARRRLGELYRAIERDRAALLRAVEEAAPRRAPNLSRVLGPDLAARILAAAGGLDRLARLPASTVQVLGAERAFFEHLRGHAPPPRHGLLFLHPAIQSAPRSERGKLSRALAGKASIASRLDRVGAPVDESLSRAFEARRAALAGQRGRPKSRRPRRGSR